MRDGPEVWDSIITEERASKPDIDVTRRQNALNKKTFVIAARSHGEPLDYYLRHDHITPQQHRAGRYYGYLWGIAYARSPYAKCSFQELPGDYTPADPAECGQEYRLARAAIATLNEKITAYNVCCLGEWAGRSRMEALRRALAELARHFDRRK